MNKDWKPEDGGCLRLYLPDPSDPNGEQGASQLPVADRVGCFSPQ
jgi:hypothetical protein